MVINKTSFPIYKIMIAFSVIVGILYIYHFLRKEKIPKKELIIFFILFFIVSILCGKLYTYVVIGFKGNYFKTGLSAYGGLIGVLIASIIYECLYPRDGIVIKYTTLSLPLIYAFTKIGCTFAGCCYGIPYNGPFAITYPHISSESLFPIQLLEVIVFIALFMLCNSNRNKKNIEYITLALIAIFKFSLDLLRSSHIGMIISPNQIFSIILLIITIIVYLIKRKK